MFNWMVIKDLYIISGIVLAIFILMNSESIMMTLNLSSDKEQKQFVPTMILMIILSPFVWIAIAYEFWRNR